MYYNFFILFSLTLIKSKGGQRTARGPELNRQQKSLACAMFLA